MAVGSLLANPKVWLAGGAVAGLAFLSQELPIFGGDDAPAKDKVQVNSSTINCALTSEKSFDITETPTELKAERGAGHAESLGYFAVKNEGTKLKIVHAWDPNVKLMGELGTGRAIRAYNGEYRIKTHKAQVQVICPANTRND